MKSKIYALLIFISLLVSNMLAQNNENKGLTKQGETKFSHLKETCRIGKLPNKIAEEKQNQQNTKQVITKQQLNRQNTPPQPFALGCNNVDFESGDFSNWQGYEGYNENTTQPLVAAGGTLTPPPTNFNSPTTGCQYFSIISGGTDPNIPGVSLTSPLGGNCARMGGENRNLGDGYTACGGNGGGNFTYTIPNQCEATYFTRPNQTVTVGEQVGLTGSAGEVLQTTFTVSAQNSAFQYAYLFAYTDNGFHDTTQQPYFKVRVLDSTGQEINCLDYFQQGLGDACGNTHAPPGYSGSLATGFFYTPKWEVSSLNLLPYVGHQITVIFTVAGCTVGAHFGYAYVDCSCAPQQIIIPFTACAGANMSLISPPLGNGVYQWTTPNGNIVSGANNDTVIVNQSGTYSVTITPTRSTIDAGGNVVTYTLTDCSYQLDTTVTLYPNPTLSVNSATLCTGTTATLNVITTGDAAPITYTWSSVVGLTFTSGDTIATANPPSSTIYTVTGTTINGCKDTAVSNVTVNVEPPPTFTAPAVCMGTATTFSNTITAGDTYQWNFGDTHTLADTADGASPSYTYTYTGNFAVNFSVTTAGGCKSNTTQTVTVNPMPTATINAPPVCLGATTIFNSTVTNGSTYTWNFGGAGTGTNITTATPTYSYSAPNTFSVSLTVTAVGNCTVNATTNVIVSPLPTASISVQPVCLGAGSVFTSTVTNGSTYSWTFGGAGTGSNITTATPTYTYLAANTFPVSLTVTSPGTCTVSATTNAVVKPIPVVDAIAPTFYCPNDSTNEIKFTCQPTGGTPTFSWSGLNGIGISITGDSVPRFLTTNTTTTSQITTFTVSAKRNGCQGPNSTFSITVYPNPVAHFVATHSICLGSPMDFTDESVAYGGLTINSWIWNFGDGGTSSSQNPVYLYSTPGAETVALLVGTSSVPSCTAQVTEPIFVNPKPLANFIGVNLQGCPKPVLSTTFTPQSTISSGNIVTWNWDFGNGHTSTSQTPPVQAYINISHNTPEYYSVSLTVTSDSGCVDAKTQSNYVEVYPTPVADFSWGPGDADIDQPVITFVNQATGASEYLPAQTFGQYGVQYNLGDTYNPGASNQVQNNTSFNHTYSDPDPSDVVETYYVTQSVINSYGCIDSITKPVDIQPIFTFYIPNAFTPNGDKKNEGFKGIGIGINNSTYNLWVFDRWGLMIYHANDIDAAWDGHMLGHEDKPVLQEDVYVWKVKFNDIFGQLHEYHGTVTLVK